MSLKVVLADESSTIKKVFQLALQDFAVEVFTAHSGEDVLEICSKNEPDIIFIDTLLQKKSGYKVCSELKKNSELSSKPVVLMWSSFVELDNDKFLACKADSEIEKPFEVQTLRDLVKSLVPEVNDQEISDFLQMPDIEPLTQSHDSVPLPVEVASTNNNPLDAFTSGLDSPLLNQENDDSANFNDIAKDDFEHVDLKIKMEGQESHDHFENDLFNEDADTDPGWVSKTLSGAKSKLNISPDLEDTDGLIEVSELEDKINTVVNQQIQLSNTKIEQMPAEVLIDDTTANTEQKLVDETESKENDAPPVHIKNISEQQIEAVITKIAQPLIEQAIWRIVPDVAQQLIEKELQRLLKQQKQSNADTY